MLFHIRSLLLLFFASACFPFAEIIDLSASLHRKTRLFSANICPQRRNKLTLILSDFHKNASVFCCIMRKSFAALLFYHSVQTRIIHFELWNIFYIMKNMLSSCATEKESPQFSPVELSSPVTCIFRYSARFTLWFLCHHYIHILVRDLNPLFVKC